MTFVNAQEATRSSLVFTDETIIDIHMLQALAVKALTAFGLTADDGTETRFSRARISAGPIAVTVAIADGEAAEETARIRVEVEKLRESETLHPEAHQAILAEVMSLLIEHLGGATVDWQPAGIAISAARFQSAFTPLHLRAPDELPRIKPRRVRPGWAGPEPITRDGLIRSMPTDIQNAMPKPRPDLAAVFREDPPVEKPGTTPALRAATWIATASVGIVNPAVGVPLVAYNALLRTDRRFSVHAFAFAMAFSGLAATGGYMPLF